MTETLAHGYSSERSHREFFNEYQHGGVCVVFKNLCIIMLWTEVALALEELRYVWKLLLFSDKSNHPCPWHNAGGHSCWCHYLKGRLFLPDVRMAYRHASLGS